MQALTEPIDSLVARYLTFATTEVKKEGGKPRAASTMSSYRRALEGFTRAVQESGLPLAQLPEDFLETKWMATQKSVHEQPVQLRIRAIAVKQFTKWLYQNNITCAPMRNLDLPTPKPKLKEPTMSNAVLQDVSQLADASREVDPIPSVQTYQQPALPTTVPMPQPQQRAVQQTQQQAPKPRSPLAAMLPTAQTKLRVRREREMDDPVFVGDYAQDRVQMAGAVEPFLSKEMAPLMRAAGISGDIAFLVCAVAPNGNEGDKSRFTISIPSAPTVAAVPAPVTVAGIPATSTREELLDVLHTSRRANEELEERLEKKLQPSQQQTQFDRGSNSEMDDLKAMVMSLAGTVRELVASRDSRPVEEPKAGPPQLDILKVMEFADTMASRRQAAATPAGGQQSMGMPEMVKMFAEMKQVFQPQNIQVDVSPMEDKLDKTIAMLNMKPKGLIDTLKEFKEAKELFQMVGGEVSNPKPTGFGSALGGMFLKFIENPAPIAEAAERVLNAARGAPSQQAPAQPQFPPKVIETTRAILAAADPGALVLATHEWMRTLATLPAFEKPVQRLSDLVREGNVNGVGILLAQMFKGLGVTGVPNEKCAQMAKDLLSQMKPSLPAEAPVDEADGEEDGDEGDEGDEDVEDEPEGPPDMNIRVGGADPEEQEEGDDGMEDEFEEGDEGDTGAEGEEAPGDGEEADAAGEEAPEEGETAEAAEGEDAASDVGEGQAPSAEEIEAAVVVTETKSQRRKRVKAEKEAEVLAQATRVGLREMPKPNARG